MVREKDTYDVIPSFPSRERLHYQTSTTYYIAHYMHVFVGLVGGKTMLRSGREGKHNNSQNGGLSMLDTACTELDIDSAISGDGVCYGYGFSI
jgi:hypothetical protein